MKFNLKNRPILDSDNLDKFDAIAARAWFEDFEKELRKIIADFENGERCPYDVDVAKLLKEEILGE
jgi:hypothetical protein